MNGWVEVVFWISTGGWLLVAVVSILMWRFPLKDQSTNVFDTDGKLAGLIVGSVYYPTDVEDEREDESE